MKTLLVIPYFNDSFRLNKFLPELFKVLPPHFHILVYNDGSSPLEKTRTEALLARFEEKSLSTGIDLSCVHQRYNLGKGASIINAWDNAQGHDILGFTDADGAVPAEEIVRLESYLRETPPVKALFGSRIRLLGKKIKRGAKRELSSRLFSFLVSRVGQIPAHDTQCGLKFIRENTYRHISPHLSVKRFAFDVELALILQHFNHHTEEMPVNWTDIPGSKVSLVKDSLQMASDIFKIKKRLDNIPRFGGL